MSAQRQEKTGRSFVSVKDWPKGEILNICSRTCAGRIRRSTTRQTGYIDAADFLPSARALSVC